MIRYSPRGSSEVFRNRVEFCLQILRRYIEKCVDEAVDKFEDTETQLRLVRIQKMHGGVLFFAKLKGVWAKVG